MTDGRNLEHERKRKLTSNAVHYLGHNKSKTETHRSWFQLAQLVKSIVLEQETSVTLGVSRLHQKSIGVLA